MLLLEERGGARITELEEAYGISLYRTNIRAGAVVERDRSRSQMWRECQFKRGIVRIFALAKKGLKS